MKRIHVIGIAFAAIFAFSLVGASGASALSLWDECMKVPVNTGAFTDSNCELPGVGEWEWLEITVKEPIDSLLVELTLTSGPVKILCLGFVDGTVGPGNENEVTLLLSEPEGAEEEITEAKPVKCELLEGGLFCGVPVVASPDNLPWLTLLTGTNDLLEGNAAGEANAPGWLVLCEGNPKSENLCSREDSLLTVENLLSALEVDLGFKPLEKAACTNLAAPEGTVEGTVSILLVSGLGLRAM
jgi:hypothetical protein